ncbi:MAG: hypothetical protein H0X69_05335 [Gemmatimonadales bacterium]|nr:hypothetical protein [Gemmatimonadales bacterium]
MAGPLQVPLAVEVVPVPSSISAQIVSRTSRPMAGVSAVFHSVAPGASAEPALDTSDGRGMVGTMWRLGDFPGRQQLTISVEGIGMMPALGAEADPVPANARVELLILSARP